MSDNQEESFVPESQIDDQQPIQYEVIYKTESEINMEKLKLLAEIASYSIIDENKTSAVSSEGAIYMNMFDEEELYRIKCKILEIVEKL